jgi:quinoprotein glucose dehydrogenase
MYITTVKSKVVALDAATGQAKWTFDPYSAEAGWNANAMNGVNRGVAYWKDEKTGRGRIFHGTSDGRLFALDAATGALVDGFAAKGVLALRDGVAEGRDISKRVYGITSAPAVFADLVIAGFAVDEGPGASLPGDIRAFDARTGKERWRFHTVPRPGEFGHDTWSGDAWKDRGGVNAWSGLTVDESRGLVFAGLGSAAFDFYGGDRPGDNLFGNSTLALDARTGQRKWHFQTTRHDIWDMDLPTPPVLVTVTHGGKKIDAAVQLTKTGFIYVFDRVSGKPLFPIEERAVPASTIPGERAATSQPVPTRPAALVRQTFSESDLSTRTPEVAAELRERFRGYKPGSTFTPPRFFQLSPSHVSCPNSPGRGTVWKRQRCLPVRASNARMSPGSDSPGPSSTANPTMTRSSKMAGAEVTP